jgi:hypothetical protein
LTPASHPHCKGQAAQQRFTLFGRLLLVQWPPSSMGSLTMGWAPFHTRLGGLCPLAWLGGAGSDLPRCRCTWAMAPGDIFFVRGLLHCWSTPPVRGCYPLLVRSRACYPPSSGGVYGESTPSGDCPDLVLGSGWGT